MHWYQPDGSPFYEVPNKSKPGETREATIRDAKKVGAYPSFSTFKSQLYNPGIVNYQLRELSKVWYDQVELVTSHGAEANSIVYDPWPDAHKTAIRLSQEPRNEAANFGIEVHDAIEWAIKDQRPVPEHLTDTVTPILHKLFDLFPREEWQSETHFCNTREKFGGMVDLWHPSGIVGDVKSQKTKDGKITFYDEWCMQLAAYSHGLDEPFAKCFNIAASSTNPGVWDIKWYNEKELDKAWEKVKLLRDYWYLETGYEPGGAK